MVWTSRRPFWLTHHMGEWVSWYMYMYVVSWCSGSVCCLTVDDCVGVMKGSLTLSLSLPRCTILTHIGKCTCTCTYTNVIYSISLPFCLPSHYITFTPISHCTLLRPSTPTLHINPSPPTNRTFFHTLYMYLGWPDGLTIDCPTLSIYALYQIVQSSCMDGSKRWVGLSVSGVMPSVLALFEDWTTEAMLKWDKWDNPTALMVVQAGLSLPLVVEGVHRAVQATGKERAWRGG